ncbi:MAG: MCE family protein [Bacteroidales bacterium]|nr:MCE family protein [Bacteroidales bacterium]MBN2697414.1 MCE family protein [Bacteroidales bacterium]
MKRSIELKIGIIGIVTLAVLIWGINYLKGKNILKREKTIYAFFHDAQGLEPSASIYLKGFKIGYVDEIQFLPDEDPSIRVMLSIYKNYNIPENSLAELYSDDLMGTKAIRILPAESSRNLSDCDTIETGFAPDLLSKLQQEILPLLGNLEALSYQIDSAASGLSALFGSEKLNAVLNNLEKITGQLSSTMEKGGAIHQSMLNVESITSNIRQKNDAVAASADHIRDLTESFSAMVEDSLFVRISAVVANLHNVLEQVEEGSGTLGKIIYNDTLYNNLEVLTRDLDILINDLKESPEDYVRISLFGGSKKD